MNETEVKRPYCESCEADELWETQGIQPVWAYPHCVCQPRVIREESEAEEVEGSHS